MPKPSTVYVCRECGGDTLRWAGQCPHCRAWNTLEEFREARSGQVRGGRRPPPGAQPRALPVTEVDVDAAPRTALEWGELNRVLGGGVVRGSLTLLGGEPGVGKSTLLMHLAAQATRGGDRVLYTSGEESAQQVGMRARRLEALSPDLLVLAENDLDALLVAIEREQPALAIVDSIQTVYDSAVDSAAGSVSQVREGASRLMRLAKDSGVPIFLVGHVTKEGAIAGPRVLEHMVDTVLYLEGERRQEFRILRATKNRFGSTEEIGVFAMAGAGMIEVLDPSALLLSGQRSAPGTVVITAMEGSRPLLVELQSLVAQSNFGLPRRSTTGFDLSRLHMILAVLEKRAGLGLANQDVYVNVAGGLRITEPAADLGLALSVAGNLRDHALPEGTVAIGELGLTGEVRRVGQMERRLAEAARRGLSRAIIPRGAGAGRVSGIELFEVGHVAEAIAAAFNGVAGAVHR